MDPSGSIFSSAKVEKWDRAEVKDLTDYLTVKESTTENTVKIWPSLLNILIIFITFPKIRSPADHL